MTKSGLLFEIAEMRNMYAEAFLAGARYGGAPETETDDYILKRGRQVFEMRLEEEINALKRKNREK